MAIEDWDPDTTRCDCDPTDACNCGGGLLADCPCRWKRGADSCDVYDWQRQHEEPTPINPACPDVQYERARDIETGAR